MEKESEITPGSGPSLDSMLAQNIDPDPTSKVKPGKVEAPKKAAIPELKVKPTSIPEPGAPMPPNSNRKETIPQKKPAAPEMRIGRQEFGGGLSEKVAKKKSFEMPKEQTLDGSEKNASKGNASSGLRLLSLMNIILGILAILALSVGFWMFSRSMKNGSPAASPVDAGTDITSEENVHYLGILPLRNPAEMVKRFSKVEEYLRKETGMNIKLKLYNTTGAVGGYTDVVRDISEGKISFAYLASVTTVQAHGNNEAVVPFACAQKGGSPTYRGDLAVKVDSPYQSLQDLHGKKVSGTSVSSTSGNLMPSAMLKESDVYFNGGMMYLGSHDKAAEAVVAGTIDGCFINEATFNKYNKDETVLRSVWKHEPVPEFPFNVNTEKVSPEELEKVKAALIKMHESNLDGVQAVNEKYEKWVEIKWEDYLSIKDAIDDVYGQVFYDLDKWGMDENKK